MVEITLLTCKSYSTKNVLVVLSERNFAMPSERQRLLELALETLENKKKQIDAEIAEILGELRGGRARRVAGTAIAALSTGRRQRRRSRFSKDERQRRSQRMKAYWENWRKQKSRQK